MKHLRLFDSIDEANGKEVNLPCVVLIGGGGQDADNQLVIASNASDENSIGIISVSEDCNDVSITININEDDLTKGQWVDLGLPSKLKWASCNLGATKPCEYGDYYMWGSVTPNTDTACNWANAPFNDGSGIYNVSYFNSVKDIVCPNDILANEYDAAKKVLGGKAHMPTKAEFDELLSNTTNEWCNCTYLGGDHKEHNVYGRKFTASNGNSIFIPASGCRRGSSFLDQGSDSLVWSSSLSASGPSSAWYLYFNSSYCIMLYDYRYSGFAVRPVSE